MPPREPGHERRDDATDDPKRDTSRGRAEEEQRGDTDQRRIETKNPRGKFRLVEPEHQAVTAPIVDPTSTPAAMSGEAQAMPTAKQAPESAFS